MLKNLCSDYVAFKGQTKVDQFSSVLGSMHHNFAVSEKQGDNKRNDRSNFTSLTIPQSQKHRLITREVIEVIS